jgi:hypothetical protein
MLILLGSLPLRAATAQERSAGEYQVKAAMLFNVAKFVEWPSEPSGRDHDSFRMCIIGRNPFGTTLDSLKGKPVKGRLLRPVQLARIDEIGECKVLFISSSEKRNLAAILDAAGRHGVLTVSDIASFAASGGMIGFVEAEGKVRLEVNLAAARQANLKISSQLLKLARIVNGGQ